MRKPESICCIPVPRSRMGAMAWRRGAGLEERGFTLIELLTVVSIMAVLSVLALPALNGVGNGSNLASAGRLMGNLVSVARSEAINQRALVQLRVITTNQSGNSDATAPYRKVSLWKYDLAQTGTSYVQFSNWESLPQGIMVYTGTDSITSGTGSFASLGLTGTNFLSTSASPPLLNTNNSTDSVTYEGGKYNYAYVGFSPTGATTFPTGFSSVYILLTQAFLPANSKTPVYTPANHPNWYQVTVNSLTGMSEVVQP